MGLHISPLDELPAIIREGKACFHVLNSRKQGNRRTFALCLLVALPPIPCNAEQALRL